MTEYERVNWEDLPSTETPLNADNLNVMDSAIAELCSDLSSVAESVAGFTDDIDLLNRRYTMIWRAIQEFIAEHDSDGDGDYSDPNAYPRTGGQVYGPVTTGRYFQADKTGWTARAAGFRINASGYAGYNIRSTHAEGVNTVPREVVFGINEAGVAGIYDRGKGEYTVNNETVTDVGSWILRATPPENRTTRVHVDDPSIYDSVLRYRQETVQNEYDVSIPHPFKTKNFEMTKSSRPPVLTSDTIGYRVSRIQTHSTGNLKLRVYGDWGNDDYWNGIASPFDGWSASIGWPEGGYVANDVNAVEINTSTSDIRLKENIEDSDLDALDLLMSFQMRQFDWKENGDHWDVGFVADEIEKLDKHLANGGGYDEEGRMIIKTIDNLYLEGVITKALQQAVKRIEVLEAKVAKLEEDKG